MKNLRIALALGLVAVTLATAVYIHQLGNTGNPVLIDNPYPDNPYASASDGSSRNHGVDWQNPVAVLIAIGGVAVALVVGSAARERV